MQKNNRSNIPQQACWQLCEGRERKKARCLLGMPEEIPEKRGASREIKINQRLRSIVANASLS